MTPRGARILFGAPSDVPVTPDAETARRWAQQELADPVYHERPNLLQLAWEWITDQLARIQHSAASLDPRGLTVGAVLVVAVVVVVALLVAGPVRRARRARRTAPPVLGAETRSAAQLRADADALAAREEWSAAVLERFRAVVRSLEDRALLDERPARTAHEVATLAATRFPTHATTLESAALLFDAVCYGDVTADRDDDARMRALDAALAGARPAPVGEVPDDALLGADGPYPVPPVHAGAVDR